LTVKYHTAGPALDRRPLNSGTHYLLKSRLCLTLRFLLPGLKLVKNKPKVCSFLIIIRVVDDMYVSLYYFFFNYY